jgi:hypothetical protein
MTGIDEFNIIASLIGIFSFIFAIWEWISSNSKIRELKGTLSTIYEIAGTAVWEENLAGKESDEVRLKQAAKTIGFMISIRKAAEHFVDKKLSSVEGELGQLIEQGIIWTPPMLIEIETSKDTTEVWLITPDLRPDAHDEIAGKVVNKNLKNGKNYVFFYPNDMPFAENEIASLYQNLGLTDATSDKMRKRVTTVSIDRKTNNHLFNKGNVVLYFRDFKRSLNPRCFEELILDHVPQRGAFWQELSDKKVLELKHLLDNEMHKVQKEA